MKLKLKINPRGAELTTTITEHITNHEGKIDRETMLNVVDVLFDMASVNGINRVTFVDYLINIYLSEDEKQKLVERLNHGNI